MSIGNTSLILDLLNAASTWVADVASGDAQQLAFGGVYTFQGLGADTYLGFGASEAAAIADGDSSHGEKLLEDAPPRALVVGAASGLWVGCSGGTLRIRRCQSAA